MNSALTTQIIRHVYKNLGITSSLKKFYSLLDDKFLLPEKIIFSDDNDNQIENNLWASQLSYEDKVIRILVANCGIESPEYCVLVTLDEVASYACYLSADNLEGMIGVFINSHWEESSIYLQANFLAGMEQLKDVVGEWTICKNFSDLKQNIISFIEYCDGRFDARQEA